MPWSHFYDPSGRVVSGLGSDARFAGQWFASENGLHQNWMRDYDATLGRYIQADPLGLVDGVSVYGYALQNPASWSDPTGEFVGADDAFDAGVAAGILAGAAAICRLIPECRKWWDDTANSALPSTDVLQVGQQCVANEEGRCEIIRKKCHSQCVDYFEEGNFPGRDQFAGIRKCIRECMKAHDCLY